jgi:hypothetical protein
MELLKKPRQTVPIMQSVNWGGVNVVKVIQPLCQSNLVALVFLADDAIHQ